MKTLLAVLAVSVVSVAIPMAFADTDCPTGYVLKPIGTAATAAGVTSLSGSGVDVRAVAVSSGTTAIQATFYDATGVGDSTNAVDSQVKVEVGSAASTTAMVPAGGFFTAPFAFSNGLLVQMNAAGGAVQAYTCKPR